MHSAGAEAAVPGIELEAEDENLIFVQWYVHQPRLAAYLYISAFM